MSDPLNWSEAGNWDACVSISALTGLVYGGWTSFPFGIYTLAEGQALEATVLPRVGDYSTLIPAVQKRYGLTIRALSTGTISDAVTRSGIGLILAGWGSIPGTGWFDANFQQYHSVFVVPKPPGKVLLFDPMLANKSAGQLINASTIVGWAKGAGVNDAREINEDEFGSSVVEGTNEVLNQITYPWPRDWATKGGPLTGYKYSDEANITLTFGAGSTAQSSGQVDISPTPTGWPAGPYQWVSNGAFKGFMVANSQIDLSPMPVPLAAPPAVPVPVPVPVPAPAPTGFTQAEVDARVAAETGPLQTQITTLQAQVTTLTNQLAALPPNASAAELSAAQAALVAATKRLAIVKAKALAHARTERATSLRFMYDINDD